MGHRAAFAGFERQPGLRAVQRLDLALLTGVDAPGTTLHVGQALADAQAMYPELVLRPADIDADRAFLERLAL